MPADNKLWIPPLPPKDQKRINRRQKYQGLVTWSGFPGKTLWDWLQLLAALAIPVVIAGGTLWFSAQQSESSSQASEKQHQTDLQIANDQQQENALQTYLDRMSDLLLNNKLHESQQGSEVRHIARARTITVLPQLNGVRKGKIVRFLYESGLIYRENVIVSLIDADLNGATLSYANLGYTDLAGANLSYADLRGAYLSGIEFIGANLRHANLSGADLGADRNHPTDITTKQLNQAQSLQGAIMPDGSLHP